MSESWTVDETAYTELLRKLDNAGLTEEERGLLSVMLSIALSVIETREVRIDIQPAFTEQFAGAFTPEKRETLSKYAMASAAGTGTTFGITCVVTGGGGGGGGGLGITERGSSPS
jgi:hypothetical protein